MKDVCGDDLELETIPHTGYCNIVIAGAVPLHNLKITIAQARAKPPTLMHSTDSEELIGFRTLDLGKGGSQWSEYQRTTGTYTHNVELMTQRYWVHLRHSSWSEEPAPAASCGLPEMRTLARLIAAKLEPVPPGS